MPRVLGRSFFSRPTLRVAKELLGKYLARRLSGRILRFKIIEVEAYDGFQDRASHASRGKTERNKIMFENGGRWYVYFVYGMHWMLNIVTGAKNYPAAILIRGAIHENGKIINGPAKLTNFLKLNKSTSRWINGKIASRKSGLWIEDRGVEISAKSIKRGSRIGVFYAGPIWSKKPWRFYLS